MWTEKASAELSEKRTYSREDLFYVIKKERPDLRDAAFRWILYSLLKQKKLFKIGYDTYTTAGIKVLPQYKPFYSQEAEALKDKLKQRFPTVSYVIFESVLLNEFLNHQIAQNTIYIQVEKDVSSYIFEYLKEEYQKSVLYNPSKKEFDKYWLRDCVVVLDLISQSPLSADSPHEMTMEKMLVDIVAEKSMAATFSPSEIPFIYDNVINSYRVDIKKMKRYAGRRGKTTLIEKYTGGAE